MFTDLFSTVEYQGYWSLPGGAPVPGTLSYSPKSGLRLSLIGALDGSDAWYGGGRTVSHEVVHGNTTNARGITLLRCVEVSRQRTFGADHAISEYQPQTALVGAFFQSRADVRFASLTFSTHHIHECIGLSGLSVEVSPPGERPRQHRVVITDVEGVTVKMGGYTVETLHGHSSKAGASSERHIDELTYVRVSPPQPESLDEFLRGPVRSIHTLLQLAADRPLAFQSISCSLKGEDDEADVDVLFQQVYGERADGRPNVLFTWKSLGANLDQTLCRWHEMRLVAGPTVDLFFTLLRMSIPLEHQFLILCQALESFHRRTVVGTQLPPEDHAARLKAIMAGVPIAHQPWLEDRLRFSNELSFASRLKSLIAPLPQRVLEGLEPQKRFVREIVDTRNYFTHWDPDGKDKAIEGNERVWYAVQGLRVVLQMVFVSVLRLEYERVLDSVWGNLVLQRLFLAKDGAARSRPSAEANAIQAAASSPTDAAGQAKPE